MECMSKICFKCNKRKPLCDFYKHKQMGDGHLNKCKECARTDVRLNYSENVETKRAYDKKRQRHSRSRIFNHRYNGIRQRVEGRATREYKVKGSECLTYEQYCMWVKSNIDDFENVYQQWASSGFTNKLAPSIDRVNNKLGYIPSNMRWVTKSQNSAKYTK